MLLEIWQLWGVEATRLSIDLINRHGAICGDGEEKGVWGAGGHQLSVTSWCVCLCAGVKDAEREEQRNLLLSLQGPRMICSQERCQGMQGRKGDGEGNHTRSNKA